MEKLLEIINSIRGNKGVEPVVSIDDATRLGDDLGFDSFDMAELTVHIEDQFGIDVFETGVVRTIGEIRAKLENEK